MATGSAWNLKKPTQPVADFDLNAIRDVPVDWSAFFTDIGSAYASHEILPGTGLEIVSSAQSAGVITARIQVDAAAVPQPVVGDKIGVTWRVTAANGERDDQTLYFKMTEK